MFNLYVRIELTKGCCYILSLIAPLSYALYLSRDLIQFRFIPNQPKKLDLPPYTCYCYLTAEFLVAWVSKLVTLIPRLFLSACNCFSYLLGLCFSTATFYRRMTLSNWSLIQSCHIWNGIFFFLHRRKSLLSEIVLNTSNSSTLFVMRILSLPRCSESFVFKARQERRKNSSSGLARRFSTSLLSSSFWGVMLVCYSWLFHCVLTSPLSSCSASSP